MPLSFTENDFGTEPSSKSLTFSEEDFAPQSKPTEQDKQVMERMLQPAVVPPMMPEAGADLGLYMAKEYGMPLAPSGSAGHELMEAAQEPLIPMPEPLSAEEWQGIIPNKTGARVAAGTFNLLTSPGRFLNSPLGLYTAGAGPFIQRLLGLAFAPGMVKSGAEKLGEAYAEGDVQKYIEGTGEVGMGGLVGLPEAKNLGRTVGERVPLTQGDVQRIAYRNLWESVNNPQMPRSLRQQLEDVTYALHPEAEPILPNVPTQPGESPGQVPVTPSGKKAGTRGSKKGVAKETQVPLNEEDAKYLEAERQGIDSPIEFVSATEPGQPFAGEIATINRKNGSIVINSAEFSAWLKSVPERARSKAVRSLLWEERIHLSVDDTSAKSYWGTLTGPEKAIVMRRYSGRWGVPSEPSALSATDLGHEAIRFRMQQLARMEPREIAEAAFREKWTLKGLTAVESAIRGTREAFGTKAAGTGKAIIDRMQSNLDVAKAIAGGSTPAALRKDQARNEIDQAKSTEDAYLIGERITAEDIPTLEQAGKDAMAEQKNIHGKLEDLRRQIDDPEEYNRAATEVMQNGMKAGMKNQFAREAIKWRRAIDEAKETGAKTLKEFGEIAIKHGVGAREEGKGLMDAVERDRAKAEPEVEGVTPLDYQSGTPLAEVERLQTEPAAMRKGKAPKEHPEFFLPPMGAGESRETHAPITPKAVTGEIQAELGGGSLHPMTFKGGSATQEAKNFVASVQRPDFESFSNQVKAKYGDVQPGQLRDAWVSGVWDYLMKAPGTELSRLRSAFGIGKEVGHTQAIADPLPELPAVKPRLSFEPLGRRPKGVRAIEAQAKTPAQKYRNAVISLLGEKLIRSAEEGKKAWNRKDVGADEIGFWRQSEEPAMSAIAPDELSNVQVLGRKLTSDARSEASTKITRGGRTYQQKAPPVSVTKRLTALLDPKTGKIELVSTFRDPRRGAVLLDPASPGQTHSPLPSMLRRYKPIYSFLLDEPVQNFRKSYKNREEFGQEFLTEARNRQAENATAEASLSEDAGKLEGNVETSVPSVLETGGKLTDAEAQSFLDNLYDEVSKIESPDDVRLLVDALHAKFESGTLTGRDWQTITTLQKVTDALQERWNLPPDQAKDQAFDELYDLAKKSESSGDFVAQAIQRYAPETGRTFPSESQAGAATQTGRELTMRERIPPTVDPNLTLPKGTGPEPTLPPPTPPEMLTKRQRNFVNKMAHAPKVETPEENWPYPREESAPKALRKSKQYAEDEFLKIVGGLYAWNKRRQTTADIVRWRDGAETLANNDARQVGNAVRVQSKDPMVRAAAKAMLSAGGDRARLDTFLASIARGRAKAELLLNRGRMIAGVAPEDAIIAKRWIEAADKLKAEVEYAKAHWNDTDLREVARVAREELDSQMNFELLNGVKIEPVRDYVPGRYDAEFFNDKNVMFGEQVLGRNFRKPRLFDNYYSAIQAGPYIPKDYDISNLVEHRVRAGRQFVNRDLWMKSLYGVTDPVSGEAVIAQPVKKNGKPQPPNNNYELYALAHGQEPFAVRKGYTDVLDAMTQPGKISKSAGGRVALAFSGLLKHGVILILDTFHPGRLGQYALSMMGPKEAGFRGGWSALEYRAADLPNAIRQGYVTPKQAAWADAPVNVNIAGRTLRYTRREILNAMQKQGLNVGRIQDAIYSDLVRSWPIIGTLNKFTFDKLTRGLMAESAVRSFEKLNKKYPNMDAGKLMRDVVKDVNIYYGSLGRQGWIRNPTLRELSQIVFLAPQWVEGLVQKELRTYGRIAKAPYSIYKGQPVMGALGSGMAKGFVSYLVLTQLLNLMTRRKLTFQNEEEGHKLDAWIPTGEDSGFWVSPMSVFAEVTHDIQRLSSSKPTVVEGFRQVGANKLGPLGRLLWVLGTRENAQGQRLTSSWGFAKEMGSQLAPAPISLGTPARYIASKIAPSMVSPPPPGAIQQRLLGAGGLKVQPGESALVQAQHLAEEFVEKHGLKKDTGFMQVPTDEPSYAKLRSALRSGDIKAARANFEALKKGRNDAQILKAMRLWAKRPLTGSWKNEMQWLQDMDPKTFALYSKSVTQRQKLWNDFLSFYMTTE